MNYPLIEAEKEITNELEKILKKLKIEYKVKIEIPPENMGDFAFPCFQLASIAKKSPNNIALEIKNLFKINKWLKKIEVNGAYINFYLDETYFKKKILEIYNNIKENFGYLENKDKKIIIEHTSANPNGPLHVGRARNPIIGDTLVRLYKAAGYNVESQFYLDDMGKQVAILAWGVNNLDKKDILQSDYDKPDHKTVGFYQKANELMQDDFNIQEEISTIIKKSEEGDDTVLSMVHNAYRPVLEGMKQSMENINIKIDKYIPESTFVKNKSVDSVINELNKSKYSDKEGKARFLDLESFGVKGRNTKFFYVRGDGTTLYATRDIAYHMWKAENSDLLINVLGEDHKLESKQVEIALNLLDAKHIPQVIFYSFVSLPGGKMSTRKGRVVYLDDLIDESIDRAKIEIEKRRGQDLSKNKIEEISKIIGIGAIRYNIIKVQPEKDITFKWEEALNFEGNAAPFIQYSHARACSILQKNTISFEDIDIKNISHKSEIILIKTIARFPNIIDEACKGFKPHIIALYLFDIAQKFNQFYRDCTVISEKDKEIKKARLFLVNLTRIVLKNGLNLLGITAPEEM